MEIDVAAAEHNEVNLWLLHRHEKSLLIGRIK